MFFGSRLGKQDTFFNEIKSIAPGHYLHIFSGKQNIYCWWSVNEWIDRNYTSDKETKALEKVVSNSLKRQLVSDVEIGAYLSGGIDSGSITAIASSYT